MAKVLAVSIKILFITTRVVVMNIGETVRSIFDLMDFTLKKRTFQV